MPFLAPLAVPAIQGGLALGGSLLASKLGKSKLSPEEQQQTDLMRQTQQSGINTGQNLIGMGSSAVQSPANYWASILSGNRGMATSAVAPEISRIGQGYSAASNASAALNPRGGPSADFLAQQPFQQQRDVSSVLQGARPQAATQLAGLGSNLLGQGISSISGSTSAGRNIMEQQAAMRQQEIERSKAIGTGLFDMIQKFGFPAISGMLSPKYGGTKGTT